MGDIMEAVREIDETIKRIASARDELVKNWEKDCVLGPTAEDYYKYQEALSFANDSIDNLIKVKRELLKR